MKFIIDAQLPLVLQKWLLDAGFEVIHTNDLPKKNRTSDLEIIDLAEREGRIVITKDSDFFKHYLLNGVPKRILMITTGNIVNRELIRLFELNFPKILELFERGGEIIEIDNNSIFIHQKN
ncbi:MAG: DUF5615 family PIN-like protein [Bacteroidia bacterium]|nr:DUF5615 family PIN-like protein [Bacteroidia bacterium]